MGGLNLMDTLMLVASVLIGLLLGILDTLIGRGRF